MIICIFITSVSTACSGPQECVCMCLNGWFCSFVMEIKSVTRCYFQRGIFIDTQSNYELILYPLHLMKFTSASTS
jgi:hypothetical protein